MSITCDNASPNDKMMTELPKRLPEFPGETNHTRCFNHTIALVAVRVVRQFDVPSGDTETIMNEAEQELRELADGIDIEEEVTQQEREVDDDDESDDDVLDWEGEREDTFILDREDLDENTRPVRMLLVKVSISLHHDVQWTYTVLEASQNSLFPNPLNHKPPTFVVCDTRKDWTGSRQDAS